MNKYCVDVEFNMPCIVSDFDPTIYKKRHHHSLDTNNFTPEFLELIDSLNLKITWAEIFYVRPSSIKDYRVHTDSTGGDYIKMNWIFGGRGSKMQWFDIKSGVVKQPVKTVIDSFYFSYNSEEVSLAHGQPVRFPSIVQVGVPHNIYNPVEDRYCVSIMFRDKTTDDRITMEEAIQRFSKYIILPEVV